MPTAAFESAFYRQGRQAVVLVLLTLNDALGAPAKTLRLATETYVTPDKQTWFGALHLPDPVSAPGALGSNDVSLCKSGFSIDGSVRAPGQTYGETVLSLAYQYVWIGAKVSMYLWEKSLTDIADIEPILFEAVVQSVEFTESEISVKVRQRTDWNGAVSPVAASREKYLNLSEESVGTIIPVRIGRVSQPKMRKPWVNDFNNAHPNGGTMTQYAMEGIVGVRLSQPGVLVDTGRGVGGQSKAKVVLACHKLAGLADLASGLGLCVQDRGASMPVSPSAGDIFNNDDEAGFYIPDDQPIFYCPIRPSSLVTVVNPADNGHALLDASNDQSFAYFDFAANKRSLRLQFPPVGDPPGRGRTLYALILIDMQSGSGMTLSTDDGGVYWPTVNRVVAVNATPNAQSFTIDAAIPGNVYEYNIWSGTRGASLNLTCTAGTAKVYAAGLLMQFIPNGNIIEPARTISTTKSVPRKRSPGQKPRNGYDVYTVKETIPATTEVEGKFFGNTLGFPDTAGGKYTGVASAVVERPCDAARLVLQQWGKEPDARITTGAGVFGAFDDARAAFKTWHQRDMSVGISLDSDSDVSTTLSHIMGASLAWVHLSPRDNKWKIVAQRAGMPITHPKKISKSMLTSRLRVNVSPDSRLVTALSLPYGWDALLGRYAYEVSLAADKSASGYSLYNLRHESLNVTALLNDVMDLRYGGVTNSFILSPLQNSYETLCADLGRLNAAAVHGLKWSFGFGGVVTPNNCVIGKRTSSGGALSEFSVVVGRYLMDAQAAAAAAAVGMAVTYSRTTRKFTFSDAGGVRLDFTNNSNAAALFGFQPKAYFPTGAAPTSLVSDVAAPEEEFFALSASAAFDWLIRTGPYGYSQAAPRTAAQVLGFPLGSDQQGAWNYNGPCPKNTREAILLAATRRLLNAGANDGRRRGVVLDGKALYDGETAREVVSRVADLFGRSEVEVGFSAEGIIGIERGMVFEFESDIDTVTPYPVVDSDGSWVGRSLMVAETEQRNGPVSFDTYVTAVAV